MGVSPFFFHDFSWFPLIFLLLPPRRTVPIFDDEENLTWRMKRPDVGTVLYGLLFLGGFGVC